MKSAPRPRLDSTTPVYQAVAAIAERLDDGGMDLWAANLRGCLRGETSAERLQHLGLELARLADSPACRRLDLSGSIAAAVELTGTAVGLPDVEELVLYRALKDVVDWLRLQGGTRWILALRDADDAAVADTLRAQAVRAVLADMVPGANGLPEGATIRAEAAIARIDRAPDATRVARCAALALRPPA